MSYSRCIPKVASQEYCVQIIRCIQTITSKAVKMLHGPLTDVFSLTVNTVRLCTCLCVHSIILTSIPTLCVCCINICLPLHRPE